MQAVGLNGILNRKKKERENKLSEQLRTKRRFDSLLELNLSYNLLLLKAGFHMIAAIAMIATKNLSDCRDFDR